MKVLYHEVMGARLPTMQEELAMIKAARDDCHDLGYHIDELKNETDDLIICGHCEAWYTETTRGLPNKEQYLLEVAEEGFSSLFSTQN